MLSSQLQNKIEDLIKNGKIKTAFDLLQKENLPSHVKQTLTIFEAEYSEIQNGALKGTIQPQDLQARKNQINDKLLTLISANSVSGKNQLTKSNLWKIFIPIVIFFFGGFYFWKNQNQNQNQKYSCPDFPLEVNNNILVIPFDNLGDEESNKKPHDKIRNQINLFTSQKKLSSHAIVGSIQKNMSMQEAAKLAESCQANLVVWGEYESDIDSFNFIVNYYYPLQPDASNFGELTRLKNVIAINEGNMEKKLMDAVNSLCGIIAFREGKKDAAKVWFDKVEGKEELDKQFLKILQ